MKYVTIETARATLSRLIEEAQAGEQVVILRERRPAVCIVPVRPPAVIRKFGALAGKVYVTDAFFDAELQDE